MVGNIYDHIISNIPDFRTEEYDVEVDEDGTLEVELGEVEPEEEDTLEYMLNSMKKTE